MVLIKDTHVRAAGGPGAAVRTAQEYLGTCRTVRIEVEVQTPEELAEALEAGPDRIMLDNMSNDQIRWCVERRRSAGASVELEASGNICAAGIRAVAETGVDFISVGSITHSVPALDIHMVLTV
jgi:nicotinate-nucleotide pyrophosphorylase (carboxylating)